MALNPLDLRWQMVRDRWPVRVKNASGSAIPGFSVVRIVSWTTTNNELVCTVNQPNNASTDFNRDYLVTGPFQIGSASTAEGLATSLAQPQFVRYDSGSPVYGDVWGPKHGQLTLTSNYYGFFIEGGATTNPLDGNKIVVAKQIGVHLVKGQIDDTNVSLGGTCTVSVFDSNRSGDTTMNITSVMNNAVALTSVANKACEVSFAGGKPELIWAAC